MPRCRLRKSGFHFNALHSFPGDDGLDAQPHGHDYELALLLEGAPQSGKMLFDARRLTELAQREVIAALDHQDLNRLLPYPSAEALAEWIWRRLRPHLPAQLRLGIELWETPRLGLEYWGDETAADA